MLKNVLLTFLSKGAIMADVTTVVTARAETTTDAQLAKVTVITMPPWKIVLVRAARVYIQTLVATIGAFLTPLGSVLGVSLSATDFLHTMLTCAGIAVGPAIMSILMNCLELLKKWDESHPMMRA